MTRWPFLLATLTTLALSLALCACTTQSSGDDDDTGDDDASDDDDSGCESVTTVCGKVFECGGWGWTDQAECEEGFLGNPTYYTECESEAGYLCCVHDCMDLDCDPDFSNCEGVCWTNNCENSPVVGPWPFR